MSSKSSSRCRSLMAALCCVLCTMSASASAEDHANAADAGRTVERSLQHADHERTYLLHLPTELKPGTPVPLVIAIHGLSMDGRSMEALTGFDKVADKYGFAVAYPDGLGRMWRFWERHELGLRVRRERGYVDDVGLLAAIIDELVQERIVDPRRVYATGISNGAYMSNRLAVSLSDKIAAIAPVAGTMWPALSKLEPPRGMPVLYIHGTDDQIIGIDGVDGFTRRKSSLDADEYVTWWCDRNQCVKTAKAETLPDSMDDGCRVTRRSYQSETGAPVVFYEVANGGHTWPGGEFQPERLLGPVCHDFNASEVIWEFFSKYTLPESAAAPAQAGGQ